MSWKEILKAPLNPREQAEVEEFASSDITVGEIDALIKTVEMMKSSLRFYGNNVNARVISKADDVIKYLKEEQEKLQ